MLEMLDDWSRRGEEETREVHPQNVLYFGSHLVDLFKYISWQGAGPHRHQLTASYRSLTLLAAASSLTTYHSHLNSNDRLLPTIIVFLQQVILFAFC